MMHIMMNIMNEYSDKSKNLAFLSFIVHNRGVCGNFLSCKTEKTEKRYCKIN